jgi:hypothetical protein
VIPSRVSDSGMRADTGLNSSENHECRRLETGMRGRFCEILRDSGSGEDLQEISYPIDKRMVM